MLHDYMYINVVCWVDTVAKQVMSNLLGFISLLMSLLFKSYIWMGSGDCTGFNYPESSMRCNDISVHRG